MKKLVYSVLVLLTGVLLVPTIVEATGVEKVDGFVCPVISTKAVLHSPKNAGIGSGDYTILGPDVSVPIHATNDNGTGTPGGSHASPGDSDYTAIWES